MNRDLNRILKQLNKWNLRALLYYARWILFRQRYLYFLSRSVCFGLFASLFMFIILSVMPLHPLAIPTVIGGGVAGAFLLMGGAYATGKSR